MTSRRHLASYAVLTLAGAAIVLAVTLLFPSSGGVDLRDRIVVGAAFVASCVLGIASAVRPSWFRETAKPAGHAANPARRPTDTRRRRGHHPDCVPFSSHVVNAGSRGLCAGCTGLAAGSLGSIVAMAAYVLVPFTTPPDVARLLVLAGLALVAVNYAEMSRPAKGAVLHATMNALLVVGFLLVAVGVLQATAAFAYGLVAVVLSFLWLDARIQLSGWRHAMTCRTCPEPCKAY